MWYKELGLLDLFFFVIFISGAVSGFKSGVVMQLSSIIGIGFSIFFYTIFFGIISRLISPYVDDPKMLPYLAAASLFFISTIASMIIGYIIRFFIRMTPLTNIDRILGSLVGSAKWLFIAILFIYMIGMANKKFNRKIIHKSFSNKALNKVVPSLIDKLTGLKGSNPSPKKIRYKKKVSPDLDF